VVQTEEPHVRWRSTCARLREECREPVADLARVWKPGERHSHAAGLEHDRARSIEDVEVVVEREERVRDASPFVIAREQEDWDTSIGNLP
jgi:hypothetical protein